MTEATRWPLMDIQPDWDAVLRSSIDKKFWVSYREPGQQKSESCYLTKGPDGQVKDDQDGVFVVKVHNSFSMTVTHTRTGLATTFLRPRRHLDIHDKQLFCSDVSGSGELGVSSSEDGKLWVWEEDTTAAREDWSEAEDCGIHAYQGEPSCKHGALDKLNITVESDGLVPDDIKKASQRNLEGHVGDVYTCRFFPSGVVVLSGGADFRLRIWSVENGSCVRTLSGHSRGITDTALIDRGRNFISVSDDGKAMLWDCGSAQCLSTVGVVSCKINACTLSRDRSLLETNIMPPPEPECGTSDKLLLLACEDGHLRSYDIRSRQNVMSFSTDKTPLGSCAFVSPTLVIFGADDGTLTSVDIRQPSSALSRWSFCSSPVKALLPVGEDKCVSGFRDGNCLVWSCVGGASSELTKLTGPEADPITSLRKSCGRVYASCRDGSVRVYSTADM